MSYKTLFLIAFSALALCSCDQRKTINDRYYLYMSDPGEYSLMDSKGLNGQYPVWEIYANDDEIIGIVANFEETSFSGTCDIFTINMKNNIMKQKVFQKKSLNALRLLVKSKKMERLHTYPLACG
jgi:hypothetical protein